MAVKLSPSVGARTERTLLSAGVSVALLGIAMSTGEATSVAGILTVGGLVTTIIGLHRFGRSGPDAPRPRKRRRKHA
jgi:hypothetical protein